MFSLIGAWVHGWVNNREAGDLRRYRDHYDVIVMCGIDLAMSLEHKEDETKWQIFAEYNSICIFIGEFFLLWFKFH